MFKVEHVKMQKVMNDLAPTISSFIKKHPELSGLHEACGHSPTKPAPPEKLLKKLWANIGNIVVLTPTEVEAHAPSSKMAVPPHAKADHAGRGHRHGTGRMG